MRKWTAVAAAVIVPLLLGNYLIVPPENYSYDTVNSITVSSGANLQSVYDAMPVTSTEPTGASTEAYKGTIFLKPGWYDVGTGLILDKTKPVNIIGIAPLNHSRVVSGYGYYPGVGAHIYSTTGQTCTDSFSDATAGAGVGLCPAVPQIEGSPDGLCDATCNASALVQIKDGTAATNGYGFKFGNLVFEAHTGSRGQIETDYAIYGCNISGLHVYESIFMGEPSRDDQIGVYLNKYRCVIGGDSAWTRIENNFFNQIAIFKTEWGNADRIINNSAFAGEGAAGSMTIPAIDLGGVSREYVAFNEIHGDTSTQGWPIGIRFRVADNTLGTGRRSQNNLTIANSGERTVSTFIVYDDSDQNMSIADGSTTNDGSTDELIEYNGTSELNVHFSTSLTSAASEGNMYTYAAAIDDNTAALNNFVYSPTQHASGAADDLAPLQGTTSPITCSASATGRRFYDTDAGAAGTADDGRLCCCGDDAAQGYVWRDCSTPTTELAGASTTDCGT